MPRRSTRPAAQRVGPAASASVPSSRLVMFFETAAETVAKAPERHRRRDRHPAPAGRRRPPRPSGHPAPADPPKGARDPVSRTYRILLVAVLAVLAVGGYWKLALGAQAHEEPPSSSSRSSRPRRSSRRRRPLIATYERTRRRQYQANSATVVRLGKAVPADDDARSLARHPARRRRQAQRDRLRQRRHHGGRRRRLVRGHRRAAPAAYARCVNLGQLRRDARQPRLHGELHQPSRASSRGSSAS